MINGWKEYEPPVKAIATGEPASDGDWPGGDDDDASFALEWLCEVFEVDIDEEVDKIDKEAANG